MKFSLKTLFVVTTVLVVIFTVIGYRVRKARQDYVNAQNSQIIKNLKWTANSILYQALPVSCYYRNHYISNDDGRKLTFSYCSRACFLIVHRRYRKIIGVDSICFMQNHKYGGYLCDYVVLNEYMRNHQIPYACGRSRIKNTTEYFIQVPFKPYHYCVGEYK